MGKGFGFWKTMPISRRSSFTSTDGTKISCPLYLTSPSMRTPRIRSFMRSSVLRNVDLPQPEGPMRAVMLFSGISIDTPLSAFVCPYQSCKSLTVIISFIHEFLSIPARRPARTSGRAAAWPFHGYSCRRSPPRAAARPLCGPHQTAGVDRFHCRLRFWICFPTIPAARLIRSVKIIRMAAMAKAASNSPSSFA